MSSVQEKNIISPIFIVTGFYTVIKCRKNNSFVLNISVYVLPCQDSATRIKLLLNSTFRSANLIRLLIRSVGTRLYLTMRRNESNEKYLSCPSISV